MAEEQRSVPRPSPSTMHGGSGDGSFQQQGQPVMDPSTGGTPLPGVAGRHQQPQQTYSMSEFVSRVEEFKSTIPDSVSNFYLQQAGFDCQDPKITRLVSLAAQKFVADIANDALAHCRVSQAAKAGAAGGATGGGGGKSAGAAAAADKKLTLTMEHLEAALSERGVKVNKPPYYF